MKHKYHENLLRRVFNCRFLKDFQALQPFNTTQAPYIFTRYDNPCCRFSTLYQLTSRTRAVSTAGDISHSNNRIRQVTQLETKCAFTTSRSSRAAISNGAISDSTATENTALVKHAAPSLSCQLCQLGAIAGIATSSRRRKGVALRSLTALAAGERSQAGIQPPLSVPKRLSSSWSVR